MLNVLAIISAHQVSETFSQDVIMLSPSLSGRCSEVCVNGKLPNIGRQALIPSRYWLIRLHPVRSHRVQYVVLPSHTVALVTACTVTCPGGTGGVASVTVFGDFKLSLMPETVVPARPVLPVRCLWSLLKACLMAFEGKEQQAYGSICFACEGGNRAGKSGLF